MNEMLKKRGARVVLVLCALVLTASLALIASGSREEVVSPEKMITITVWDQFGYEGTTAAGPAMDKLVGMYEGMHPNVRIDRTVVPQGNIRDQLRIAMGSGTEPNMFYTWPAAAVLTSYARQGKLLDLTEAANKYGWFHKLPELEIKRCSHNGKLYAFPCEQDYLFAYYNKDMFRELRLSEPDTYQEFLGLCEKIKNAGYTPITFGNRAKWPATNTLSYLLALVAGKERQEEVLFGDTPWANNDYVQACNVFMDWANKGYFPRGFNGIDYGEANSLFTMGRAAMNITGSWIVSDMVEGATFDLGIFYLPPINPDLSKATMMGEGSQWSISASTPPEAQDVAVDFLAFLMSDENIRIWVEEGYLVPIRKGGLNWDQFDAPEVVEGMFEEGDSMQTVNGYDLHTTVPESVTETLYNQLQLMLDKKVTPRGFLQAMQEDWEKAKRNGEVWIP
jgi:raffinose/stachyose/melibiose transport system substrate-binding protein